MKTLIEVKHVPAEDVEITTYGCEHCDFTADDKDAVEQHYAVKHACKAEMVVGEKTLRRFETEADAKAWMDQDDCHRVREIEWAGPGWYATETWTQPCPRNCCRDACIRLFSADAWVGEAISKARDIMTEVAAVRRAIREVGHAPG